MYSLQSKPVTGMTDTTNWAASSPRGLTYLGSFTFRALPSAVINILGGFTFFFLSLKVGGGWEQGAEGRGKNKQEECKLLI